MDPLNAAINHQGRGEFAAALNALDQTPASIRGALQGQLLYAELFEVTGRHSEARAICERLRRSRLTPTQRAKWENIFGRLLLESGDTDAGTARLQHAAMLASKAADLALACSIDCKLLSVVSERSGPEAATPLLSELRRATTRLGDAHATAQLHLLVAEMEATRGSFDRTQQHAQIAERLLADHPNAWLTAHANNIQLAVSLLQAQFDEAEHYSELALTSSEISGAAAFRRAAAANTGNLYLMTGEFERAVEFFKLALTVFPSNGNRNNGILEALAQVRLAQGQWSECNAYLDRIDSSIKSEQDRTFYSHRVADLTRSRLLLRLGKLHDASKAIERAVSSCRVTGDRTSLKTTLLTKAEILLASGASARAVRTIGEATAGVLGHSPESTALYHNVIGRHVMAARGSVAASMYYERAKRVCRVTGNIPTLVHVSAADTYGSQPTRREVASFSEPRSAMISARDVLHGLMGVIIHSSRAEIIGAELAHILVTLGCAAWASVETRNSRGVSTVVFEVGERHVTPASARRRFVLRESAPHTVELIAWGQDDLESVATLDMVGALLESLRDIQAVRSERQKKSSIWVEEVVPVDSSGAVIGGHMRELMSFAQRVARTTVNVMITGESGTGKEILARAIHDFSDRAQKPFVPLNCAAVPRDLLESQLFGHRRGAFTGAERDQLGLIRSAEGGTLFLDEVGEMSLELQPKLLRFLEAGEIAPLGEPAPLTVHVRVVAATNANLEDAVRDGRFREDLFYRLNVVRLAIKPLRERRDEIPALVEHLVADAAREYKKGHLDVAEETMERLLLYRWPGNVRQLHNELRRMVALAEPNSTLGPDLISPDILGALPLLRQPFVNGREVAVPLHEKLAPTLSRIEYEMIKAALRENQGRLEPAAKALGISRKGLYLKRQRLGL
jgi:DNA-binding NtrC family response regulator/tetratricopeptide (TPR) repeat protein